MRPNAGVRCPRSLRDTVSALEAIAAALGRAELYPCALLLLEALAGLEVASPQGKGSVLKLSTLNEIRGHMGQVMAFSQFAGFSVAQCVAEEFARKAPQANGEVRVLFRLESTMRPLVGTLAMTAVRDG